MTRKYDRCAAIAKKKQGVLAGSIAAAFLCPGKTQARFPQPAVIVLVKLVDS